MNVARLEVRALQAGYGREVIAAVPQATLEGGRLHVLFGANGSGKTTLARTFLGLLAPLRGSVELTPKGGRSYVPQLQALPIAIPITVAEWIELGLPDGWSREKRRARTRHALAQVGMECSANHALERLSGGQRQRVTVARALAQEARLWILDEPTSGMDRKSAQSLWGLLSDLARDPARIVIVITHDHFDGPKHAGQTWVLEDGGLSTRAVSHG